MTNQDYDKYIRAEWDAFVRDPARSQASLDLVAGIPVTRVLDIGCGAGQEMVPFVDRGAFGVGLDVSPEVGLVGRRRFADRGLGARVAFLRCSAEQLPFPAGSFDVVLCRLALPYTDNARSLAETSRVLRPGGVLFLKIHHARFYLRKFWQGLTGGELLSMIHATRVMAAGAIYHVAGKQVRHWLISNETFQSRWLLRRELAHNSLRIAGEMPDSNSLTPSFVVVREGS